MTSAATRPCIAFLTDYGLDDPFVGVCHAVVAGIAPDARVIDLGHGLAPQAVRQGAAVLADALPWLPPGAIVLAVVDPGVGTRRRALVLAAGTGDGHRLLVGPDNGLLVPCAEACGGVTAAWALPVPAEATGTFDGRDVFAPAAARLAAGVPPGELGSPVPPASLVPLALPPPETAPGLLRAEVLGADRFGNLQLVAGADALAAAGLSTGTRVQVSASKAAGLDAVVGRVFADAEPGAALVLPDAFGRVQVAVNQGSAADRLHAAPGDTLTVAAGDGRTGMPGDGVTT